MNGDARSTRSPTRTLIAAVSARMLAQLAVADGYPVVTVDRFGDADLRAVAPGATARSNAALVSLADRFPADAVLYGAGLENRPDLVMRLADGRELLGTPPEALVAARNPWAVAAAARAAGARAPETRRPEAVPAAGPTGEWLRKPRHGGGGRGVRRWAGGVLRSTEVLQRHMTGLSCSAVAIADGRRAATLGVTEQLHRPRSFQWAGNLAPPRLSAGERGELHGRLSAVCDEVARRFGVRGAFGVDAIWDGREAWVLEVNPRPPASLELFGPGAFAAHVHGARGLGVPGEAGAPPVGSRAAAKLVLYAPRELRAPEPEWWPAGLTYDIPRAGETIRRGAPVCTLMSADADVDALAARGADLLAALAEEVLVCG